MSHAKDSGAPATLVAMLQRRASREPASRVHEFLDDAGGGASSALTFLELDRRARAIAALIQAHSRPGDRVLLLHPPGLDYVAAFYACLYAGAVAVPVFPPDGARGHRGLARIRAIATDAQASLALTTRAVLEGGTLATTGADELAQVRTLATDALPAGGESAWRDPALAPSDLALLQYTSGSTTSPRGVMLTHANMLANAAIQRRAWRLTERSVGVTWLPLYHDLGVISCLIQPVYSGFRSVMMSPTAFMQRPLRWLKAIADHRGTFAGGPNFAFDLCVRKTTPAERSALDLAAWDRAFNGAEPIRAETLAAFTAAFAASGFRREAMYPCYGLAEANFVSGGLSESPPVVVAFDRAGLERGHAQPLAADVAVGSGRALVGCGTWQEGQDIRVVDPESRAPRADGEVGEVWVSGPSVAQGYWRRDDEADAVFRARLATGGDGAYLRTGDLGFVYDGELYVAGRLKDLVIIRGLNHYPQDIERTVERASPGLRAGCGAVFSIDVDGEERLALVQEFEGPYSEYDAVFARLREAIAAEHDLELHGAVLVAPGGVPKTTSGKIQRAAARAGFLANTLSALAAWRQSAPAPAVAPATRTAARKTSRATIEAWLVDWLSRWLKLEPSRFDLREPFARYGFDSLHALELTGDLEDWLGRPVPTAVLYAHPNIASLAEYLARNPGSPT